MALGTLVKPLFAAMFGIGAALAGSGASAQGLTLDEVRAGGFFHNAYQGFLPTSSNWTLERLHDLKFSALFASPDVDAFAWIGNPRPEVGVTLNLDGFDESLVHANLNWQIPVFDTPLYLEAGFGAALTNAALDGAARPARNLGCPLAFYDAFGVGANLSDDVTLTVRYEHISNLELCSPNDGLSNLGVMLGVRF